MSKKSKAPKIIGFSLLALVILSIIGASIVFFSKQTGFGGTIISLQQVNFQSSDSLINGKSWLLTMVQNGASQFASGSFTANELNQKTQSTEKVKYPLQVTLESTPQTCQYKLNSQSDKIYTIESINKGRNFKTLSAPKCSDLCGNLPCSIKEVDCVGAACLKYDTYCYKKTASATYGTVEFDKLSFTSNVIATINGQEYKGAISNADQNSVSLGDGRVYASWVGNLVSGMDCPRSSEQNIAAVYFNGWRTINNQNYISYKNYDLNGFQSCIERYISGSETPQSCASEYNSFSNNVLSNKEFVAVGGTTQIQNAASTSDGKIAITLGKAIQFPTISMRIKADLLGVVVPTSQPKIVSTGSECFTTGSNGFITTNVKNIGDEYATFTVAANCPSPFSQTGGTLKVQLAPQTSEVINIPITGQGNDEIKKECTITVADLENPAKKDTASVDTCVKPIILCNSDETRCNGAVKEKCNTAGSGWDLVAGDETCKIIAPPKDCKPVWSVAGITIIPNIKCFSFFNTILWIVTVIGGLFTFLMVFTFANRVQNKAIQWVISILISLGAASLIFMLFWWGILVFILLLILRAVIPKP